MEPLILGTHGGHVKTSGFKGVWRSALVEGVWGFPKRKGTLGWFIRVM